MPDPETTQAGRPSKYGERMKVRSLPMPEHLARHAEEVGDSFSDGVRKCIEWHMQRQEDEDA